ncbi:MAG TPA: DUF2243 domain-containing protein [Burkholderiales bacterium]|nr:DUF2243 domain-containing protein [Burkholderiales bacterium]
MRSAALLLGVGLGGFLDGIVLHQIAHWHQMLSAVTPPVTVEAMKLNMAADGWFHIATWLATFAGALVLWGAAQRAGPLPSTRAFFGYLLLGWGGFNLVEGIVDHHVLALHHVRDLPAHVPLLDWLFLLVAGGGLVAAGLVLRRARG